ncbi:hypothetical protein ThidrDRAFT_3587 [Thiorhodococcus drewsii AZ1]|uniref:Uncharacterized protein n=1 Tax=Thiorhodococcus drewsii AZ1 TaxID=765913 RepID=G2E5M4_9GAMM|nr:hypothetical protein [Thiorhodococcus drewsii]EGV28693.1 hypothetical protein ThidrDRAFT_3587 [Thiorhodococcus drewsii AZ1]
MDPITALLASYLTTAAQSISNEAFSHMDLNGTTTETAEIQDITVSFDHVAWKIQDRSVCKTYRNDVMKMSKCTHAAKDLFIQTCDRLTAKRLYHPDYPSLKRMYCTAARQYRPTQASVEWASPTPTNTDAQILQECRLAKAALLTENTPENRYIKKQACDLLKKPE